VLETSSSLERLGKVALTRRLPITRQFDIEAEALFRADHHQHLPAFHARILLDLCDLSRIFLNACEQVHAKLTVREFATAEAQRDLDLVAFADELVNCLHFGGIIMVIDVGTHLDLFDLLRLLALAGEVGLFLGLIFEFTDVEEFGDRRIGVGRDFNQIETKLVGLLHRFLGVHDAQIFAIFVDHPHLRRLNEFVETRAVGGVGRWAERAAGGKRWYGCVSKKCLKRGPLPRLPCESKGRNARVRTIFYALLPIHVTLVDGAGFCYGQSL
jgi:hypothetical protein